jgi:hypothetical protein
MKMKGRRFERVSDMQRASRATLDSIEEMASAVLLKGRKNDGISVYAPVETGLENMAANTEWVKPTFFFYLVRELSDKLRHTCQTL